MPFEPSSSSSDGGSGSSSSKKGKSTGSGVSRVSVSVAVDALIRYLGQILVQLHAWLSSVAALLAAGGAAMDLGLRAQLLRIQDQAAQQWAFVEDAAHSKQGLHPPYRLLQAYTIGTISPLVSQTAGLMMDLTPDMVAALHKPVRVTIAWLEHPRFVFGPCFTVHLCVVLRRMQLGMGARDCRHVNSSGDCVIACAVIECRSASAVSNHAHPLHKHRPAQPQQQHQL